ncbi:MAG: phosphate signaling complex protein PhoU [Chloroflexota bacterium]
MTRNVLERELRGLQDEILRLGSEVEENLGVAVEALRRRDMARARHLIKADEWINQRRIQIGMRGLSLIATQQPFASDMRQIAAMIEIAGELERIHDYVKGIAKINVQIDEVYYLEPLIALYPQMAVKAQAMLRGALDAFVNRDAVLARQIPAMDDEVDALYKAAYRVIVRYVGQTPTAVEMANQIEWVGHNLERSADRVINICEWVIYMVTGVFAELDSEYETPPLTV